MSTLSYLNPKQYAAKQIARDIIKNSDSIDEIKEEVKVLAKRDIGLSKRVVTELEKFGYRVSIDS